MAKHKKKHRSHARSGGSRRRRSRSFLRNPARGSAAMGLLMAVGAGALGYVASRGLATVGGRYLPAMVPPQVREPLATGLSGAIVIGASEFSARWTGASALTRAAVAGAAAVPLLEAGLNMTPLGAKLGTSKTIMIEQPAPGQPAGVGARLNARLAMAAALRSRSTGIASEYRSEY